MGVRGSHMWMCKLLLLRGATGGTKMPSLWWLKRIRSVVIDILSNFPICYKVRSLAFLCRGCITKWNTNVPRWAQRGRRHGKSWFQMETCRGILLQVTCEAVGDFPHQEPMLCFARSYTNLGHAPSSLTAQSSRVKSPYSNPSKNVSTNSTTRTSSMCAAPTCPGDNEVK